MKQHTLLAAVLLLTASCVFSQRIYFCKNYTSSGEPIEMGSTWTINSGGGSVYILFQNGGRTLNVNSITVYIDKMTGTSGYLAWENKYPATDPNKTWYALDYKFTSAGDYKVKVLINSVEVATEYVTVKSNAPATASGNASTSSNVVSYSGSSVTTGTDIDLTSGYVYGLGGSFNLNSSSTSRVYFKVSNGVNKLGTTKLIVDIYKMNTAGTYEFYITKNYDISDLNWVYFSYDFYAAGTYKVSVYNGGSTWINTAYVNIYGSNSNASGNNASSPGIGTDYYSGSSVTAGTDIDTKSGYVYGLGGPFKRKSLINKSITVYFKVDNGTKSINTSQLIVDLWKMNKSGTYDVYKTKKFDIKNSSLSWIFFSYEFEDQGEYKIMVYNANSAWINTSYLSID